MPSSAEAPFDVDEFLDRPLVAHVATSGPMVRPVWFLWEQRALWWLTGPWSKLRGHLDADLVGDAEVVDYDEGRARRKLAKYLGWDESRWPSRFRLDSGPSGEFVRLSPQRMTAQDLSFTW